MDFSIKPQIEKLLAKTKEGKISWMQVNKNTIRWTSTIDNELYIITIQGPALLGISTTGSIDQFIFTIQSGSGELLLQLQSNAMTNPEFQPLLKELFQIAFSNSRNKTASVLDKLIDNLG